MPFGSEQNVLQSSPVHKLLWKIRGDFHIGRWIRFFYLKKGLRKLKTIPGNILDAGCGKGQTTFFLEKKFPNSRIKGIDVSDEEIGICEKVAAEISSRAEFSVWDLQQAPFSQSYDLIILNNVLSAIPDFEKAVKNVSQSLTAGGWLIIQDMNAPFLYKKYGNTPAYQGQAHMGFSLDQLKYLLNKEQFRVSWAQHAMGFWGDWAHRLFDKTRKSSLLLNALFPLYIIAAYLDSLSLIVEGSGLFLIAQKL
jgi:SAM-dependent methyltransferase